MKTCSECGTQYEDHIEHCLVDGSELPPPEEAAPVAAAGSKAAVPLLLIGALLFGVVAVAGIVAVVFLSGGEPAPPPKPTSPPNPIEAPAPVAPAPTPPPEPVVAKVGFTSDPPGATLFEGDTQLCVTPCTVEHPEDASLPRTFRAELEGRKTLTHTLTDPSVPQFLKLESSVVAPRPTRPRPIRPRPTPTQPQPATNAPSIGTKR